MPKYNTQSISRELAKHNIELVGEYKGMLKRHTLKHSCGHQVDQVLNNVLNIGTRCPLCAGKSVLTSPEKIEKELAYSNCQLVGNYEGANIKTHIHCSNCGHDLNIAPGKIINGDGCPICRVVNRYKIK